MAGAASAADIVRRDTGGSGGHGHGHGSGGGGGHDHGHAAAAPAVSSGYSEPAQGYSAPSSGYSQPESSYAQPAATYGQPTSGYAQPSGYGGYDVGYEEEGGKFDISAVIIPILIVFGLSLLFPTITSVAVNGNGRRRRDVEDAANPLSDVVERVNSIYMAVVESEECMERIACEIGGLASDAGLRDSALSKMADPLVPLKYKKFMTQFKAGQNCHKLKCGQIF